MAEWWEKGELFPKERGNFLIILEFFLFNCPVKIITQKKDGTKECELVSKRAITFEDRDWIGGKITTLFSEITRNIITECVDNNQNVDYIRAHKEEMSSLDDEHFELIVFKKDWRINKTKSIFYSIRNALAHGAFSVVNKKDPVYYFENVSNGVKAQIRLKESTLLRWIDLFNSSADDIRSKRKAKTSKANKTKKAKKAKKKVLL